VTALPATAGAPVLAARLRPLVIAQRATIRDALRAIDAGGLEIALMLAADGRLLGTVSDGDVRRALLRGAGLDDPVAPHRAPQPHVVGPDAGRAAVLDLMRARSLSQIPVVDGRGRLLGLHVIRELLGAVERDNWAVVMAGGRGVRLAPLTDTLPKPMMPIAGRPLLERLVLHLVGSGIRRIALAVNYLAEVIEAHFGDGAAYGCRIAYLREEPGRPLGTGGALGLLAGQGLHPAHPLLVLNGDLLTAFSVERLLASHAASGAAATLAVRNHVHEIAFGVAEVEGGRLRALTEKPALSWPINAGIYVLDPTLLPRIPAGVQLSLPSLLEDCLRRGEPVNVWEVTDDWQDIGRPADLARARGEA
jgi:dTDP-glucose pyrophosphorylase/CBS domain-containing protein